MDWLDWILLLARVVIVFVALLVLVMLVVWVERKVVADMQTRLGPRRAGPFGVLITLADGIKLFFKEGVTPVQAERPVYVLAPVLSLIPALLAFAVVPFGTGVTLFGRHVPFQLADLNVGVLFFLAMGSLAIYGIVLAGWASGSAYPLLGGIRSSAQMISYEVGMGLGLVAVLMYAGTLQMSEIVARQGGALEFFGTGVPVFPRWNIVPQLPAFLIFMYAALAETNRPPFDMPEAESELVAGYHTEYSGIRFAMFFLAEYLHMITISAVAVTLFLGGWRGPIFGFLPWLWPTVWFFLKVALLVFLFVWVRATIPRIRYDRLMRFGWKVVIPFSLLWILLTGAIVVIPDVYGRDALFRWLAIGAGVVLLLSLVWPLFSRDREAPHAVRSEG
ncbi:MAG TPA: NADH-quinone oxidoreductase subunit NuoH [Actinomycetota bacterium]|nr:NADH-quinone oxidoreductase subunit NuoH [Actinomycetota bacterium]